MEQVIIIITQLFILASMVGIGYIGARKSFFTVEAKDIFGKLIIKITMPALVLFKISRIESTPQLLHDALWVLGIGYSSIFLLFCVTWLVSRVVTLPPITKRAMVTYAMFGNIGFMGIPIFDAMFPGGQGVFFALLFNMLNDSVLWSFGLWYLIKDKKPKGTSLNALKQMINPIMVSFAVAVVFFIFKIHLPEPFFQICSQVGAMTVPLSMLFIGITLAQISVKSAFLDKVLYLSSTLKLLIVPTFGALILKGLAVLFNWQLPMIPVTVALLEAAMPAMAVVVIVVRTYGGDEEYCAKYLLLSHILCVVTLPIMTKVLQFIY